MNCFSDDTLDEEDLLKTRANARCYPARTTTCLKEMSSFSCQRAARSVINRFCHKCPICCQKVEDGYVF